MLRRAPRPLGGGGLTESDSVGHLLLGTLPGRALVVGVIVRLLAWVAQLVFGRTALVEAVSTIGTLALLVGIGYFTWRLVALAKRQLLWRVRRKLILSYIFVGLVPALLIIVFFALSGWLLFSTVSSYVVQTRLRALTDHAQFLARTTAIELARGSVDDMTERLERKQASLEARYPDASMAVVPIARTCASDAPLARGAPAPTAPLVVGPWPHLPPPADMPAWVGCPGFAGLIAYWVGSPEALATTMARRSTSSVLRSEESAAPGEVRFFVRAVALPDGPAPRYAVVLDLPMNESAAQRLQQETGIELRAITLVRSENGAMPLVGRPDPTLARPTAATDGGRFQPPWVVFLEYTDWNTGLTGSATQAIGMRIREIYDRLSPSTFGSIRLGQALVFAIAIVGVLFLLIQFVALVMGLALARSITGSVHELFVGTERVRQGDFTHHIQVRAKDQLGELADSFNSMTARLGQLLAEMAEKKRLEEELRIARTIQMSLLPQNPPVDLPGVTLTALCYPAREVGGDYYDFLPLGGHRLGLLIADVSGKGTSAALYMAELKGLMLSLSEIHRSPRELLIAANRIISTNLDNRSFITMTYAVLDLDAGTMTWARAGHTPLIHLPSRCAGPRKAQILTPDGMVLGLRIDDGTKFKAALEEVTLPLAVGDLFMFFTDGLSEQMNLEEDLFGEPRLGELIEEHSELPFDELRERIVREVRAFAGGASQHDDMTFILLRVDEVSAQQGQQLEAERVLVS